MEGIEMRTSRAMQAAFIAEQIGSGETIGAFCSNRGLAVSSFLRWQKNLGHPNDNTERATFVPVRITSGKPRTQTGLCIIRIGADVSIECREDTPQAFLELILQTVLRACGQNWRG